jgi:hypothetical protein
VTSLTALIESEHYPNLTRNHRRPSANIGRVAGMIAGGGDGPDLELAASCQSAKDIR